RRRSASLLPWFAAREVSRAKRGRRRAPREAKREEGARRAAMPPAEAPSERSRRLVRSRKRLLAVEGAEVLGLDEVESRAADAVEQRNDLPVSDARAVRPQETAAPVVRAECLGEPGRPDLDPAIADPAELHRLSGDRREDLPEL